MKIDPTRLEELKAFNASMDKVPGQVAVYVYQMDADPGVLYVAAVFASKEA
jgi:hypothetical protein